jgi:predicted Zn-dependent protease
MRSRFLALTVLVSLLPVTGLFAHGAYHELLNTLTREVEQKPGDAALLLRRAKLHLSHEEWGAALADLELVDRLRSGSALTNALRGQALNQGRQWGAALHVLNAHLREFPDDCEALFERGRARFHLGDTEAADDYRRWLTSAKDPASTQVLEAVDAIKLRDGAKTAAAFIDKFVAKHQVEPAVLERAASLAVACGEWDVALRHMESLQKQAPRPEPWMAQRARVLVRAGREDDARAAWAALRDHLQALPSLERGTPLLSPILAEAKTALGLAVPAPVIAPPLSASTPSSNSTLPSKLR